MQNYRFTKINTKLLVYSFFPLRIKYSILFYLQIFSYFFGSLFYLLILVSITWNTSSISNFNFILLIYYQHSISIFNELITIAQISKKLWNFSLNRETYLNIRSILFYLQISSRFRLLPLLPSAKTAIQLYSTRRNRENNYVKCVTRKTRSGGATRPRWKTIRSGTRGYRQAGRVNSDGGPRGQGKSHFGFN